LLDQLTTKVRPGGHILFYKGSFAFGAAEPIIAKWEKAKPIKRKLHPRPTLHVPQAVTPK
jgi:hypothetical protein